MNQYRLRIDELNDGTKKYYVQKRYSRNKRWWSKQQEFFWADYSSTAHFAEKDAIDLIESLKVRDAEIIRQQVKSTTYKDV